MFKSVRIQNFRQFKDLKLDGLAQINLITGKNNTGKTSLLESLFLFDGPTDPSRTVVVANFRGVDRVGPETPEFWDWLFRDGDRDRRFEIEGRDRSDRVTKLGAGFSRGSLIPVATNGASISEAQSAPSIRSTTPLPTLTYQYEVAGTERVESALRWTYQGLALEPDRRPPGQQGFFLPEGHRAGESEAVRLSQLLLKGREAALIEALKVIEPRLKNLTVLNLGDRSSVYADLGQYPLVPLAMMGQGFGRLLIIIAAMVLKEGPIYLIDELDAGFHYSTLADVWKVIVKAAIDHSAQVFATTHSYECVEAAVKGSAGYEGRLAMFRLERDADRVRAVDVDDEGLRDAVSLGFEMR
jgi:hypothetical protein